MHRTITILAAVVFLAPFAPVVQGATEEIQISEANVRDFLIRFEEIAARKDFDALQHLVHERAFFRFNDGDFIGREAIRAAFEKTWESSSSVENEKYYLTDIQVLSTDRHSASATYTYNWEGTYEDQTFAIKGRGTRVLVRSGGEFQIIHEHLSRFPQK